MALVEVYGGQPEELSFQANHRCIIKRKYLICTLGAMANMPMMAVIKFYM